MLYIAWKLNTVISEEELRCFAVLLMHVGWFSSVAIKGQASGMISCTLHFFFSSKYPQTYSYLKNVFLLDTVLDSRPNQLMQNPDQLGMIDAGFFINTSSAPLLRPQREVDVIIYLSYTTGSHTSVRMFLLPCVVSPFIFKCSACSIQNCWFYQPFTLSAFPCSGNFSL